MKQGVSSIPPGTLRNHRNPAAFAGKSVPQEKSRAVFRKKSVLFERSEFTDFKNIVRLFSFWRLRA